MKKLIALLVVVTMFLSNINLIYAETDNPSGWAEEAILFMKSEGAVPDRLFNRYKTEITRSEFASLIVNVVESKLNTTLSYEPSVFIDTNSVDVNKAYKMKIISGVGNQKFNPDGLIKREEIAIMFVNTLKALDGLEPANEHIVNTTYKPYFSDANLISSWALSSVQSAYNNGIISGVGNDKFNPKGSATREQAIMIAYNVWSNLVDKNHIPNLKVKFAGELIDETTVKSDQNEQKVEEKTTDLDAVIAERFEYNGRYYPQAYWNGNTEAIAKANFIEKYNFAFKKGNDPLSAFAYVEYLTDIRYDESIYNAITKDILAKYPIMLAGTPEEKKQRQLEQILELNRWFVFNTDYSTDFSDHMKDNIYNMNILIASYAPDLTTSAYGTLEMDKYVSKEFRGHSAAEFLDIDMALSTDAYKVAYKKYHDVQLEGQTSLQEFLKIADPTFTGKCTDYSDIFYYVARQMGIDTNYVGTSNHLWNIVRFADGSIIHFDETQADQGFQSLEVLSMTGRNDSRKAEVVTEGRLIELGSSQKRLTEILGDYTRGNSQTVPTGDAWAVFGSEANWNKFYDAYHINKGTWN